MRLRSKHGQWCDPIVLKQCSRLAIYDPRIGIADTRPSQVSDEREKLLLRGSPRPSLGVVCCRCRHFNRRH